MEQQTQAKFIVTPEQVKSATFGNVGGVKAKSIADALNEALPKYGMDNSDILPDFFCQLCHESGYFRHKVENLNYSAGALRKVFSKYFTIEQAQQYANKPEKIANRVYANRMGNGNEASGDGWRNRGGGYIMLTGAETWEKYTRYLRERKSEFTVDRVRDLVRNTEEYAMDSACWFFAVHASLKDEAMRDDVTSITRKINGGYLGIVERKKLFEQAKIVFVR